MNIISKAAIAISICGFPVAALADDWTPPGPITMMIGFSAGGGADTQARLIASAIEADTGWRILPEQVGGNGGLNLSSRLKEGPADGTVIGMVVSETPTYNAIAAGRPDLSYDHFTPLATTAAFQSGIVAMANGDYSSWEKIKQANAEGENVRFGTASERQADLAYHLSLKTGVNFNIVVLEGGSAVMNRIRGGDLDIGWVAGGQARAVRQGQLTNIVNGISTPLAETPDAPSILDLGSDYYLDGHFMFLAPGDLPEEARTALAEAIKNAINNSETSAYQLIETSFGGADVIVGNELEELLANSLENAIGLRESVYE